MSVINHRTAQFGEYPARIQVNLIPTDTLSGTFFWSIDRPNTNKVRNYRLDVNNVPWDIEYTLQAINVEVTPRQSVSVTPSNVTHRKVPTIAFTQNPDPQTNSFVRFTCNGDHYEVPKGDVNQLKRLKLFLDEQLYSLKTAADPENWRWSDLDPVDSFPDVENASSIGPEQQDSQSGQGQSSDDASSDSNSDGEVSDIPWYALTLPGSPSDDGTLLEDTEDSHASSSGHVVVISYGNHVEPGATQILLASGRPMSMDAFDAMLSARARGN